jgi:ornithine cyclodeaminase/alanine dehydrogenase
MLFFGKDDLSRLLTMSEAIELVEQGFLRLRQKKVVMPPRAVLPSPYHEGSLLYMPVLIKEDRPFLVTKVITVYPKNQEIFGIPALQGFIILFDAENGLPLAILDAHFLTALRTGAAGGVAIKYLARKDSRVVTLFGAGPQAKTQLEAACSLLGIEKCFLISNQDPREEDFAREMTGRLGISIIITGDKKTTVENSDIIITATNSRVPVFDGTWLRPGTHITAIGSFNPEVRELDSETIRRAKIFVDSLPAAREEAGDLIIPVEEGIITWEKVVAEIGEVIAGEKKGRENLKEITVFKSVGLAVQDAIVARGAYLKALSLNSGIRLF